MTKYIMVLPNGTEISSGTGTTNAIASVSITSSVNSETELTMGSVCATMVEITLITPNAGLSITAGDEITLYQASENGSRTKIGLFTVNKPTRPSANRMKLTAYDRIIKLDKDISAWLASLEGWPYTITELANLVCAECGVTRTSQTLPNGSFSIESNPTSEPVTGRQMMKWIAEIAGRFVTADANGNITFSWYTTSSVKITPNGSNYYFSESLEYENYTVKPADAVKLRLADAQDGALWPAGETENPYIVSGNKLLSLNILNASTSVLDTMLQSVNVGYTPCRITIPASTNIKAGQIVTVTDRNGKTFQTYIMHAHKTGQRLTLESTGSSLRNNSENLNTLSDAAMKEYVDSVANSAASSAADSAVKGLEEMQTQEYIFNKLTNNGEVQGLYLKDGKVYLNATFIESGFISADIIRAGYIRSEDFEVSNYEILYPSDTLYPSNSTYPSNGEQIVKGIEIDFEHGVIRGIFWSNSEDAIVQRIENLESGMANIEDYIKKYVEEYIDEALGGDY